MLLKKWHRQTYCTRGLTQTFVFVKNTVSAKYDKVEHNKTRCICVKILLLGKKNSFVTSFKQLLWFLLSFNNICISFKWTHFYDLSLSKHWILPGSLLGELSVTYSNPYKHRFAYIGSFQEEFLMSRSHWRSLWMQLLSPNHRYYIISLLKVDLK